MNCLTLVMKPRNPYRLLFGPASPGGELAVNANQLMTTGWKTPGIRSENFRHRKLHSRLIRHTLPGKRRRPTVIREEHDPPIAGPPRGRFTIVYLIHEAFRRDLGRLSAAVRGPGVDSARADQLGAHWEFVNEQLHHHHRVEDESLWPLIRPKLAGRQDELAVLDEMESEHLSLVPKCQAVEEGFASFSKEPGDLAGRDLSSQLDDLLSLLAAHLDAEESLCFPVIDEALSPEEFESFGKATAKSIGMRGSARFFPWIFDGSDVVERKAVLGMPPLPVRILCTYVWEPRYERQVATLWT
jgi:iron-sulfur cluster repair protein YtfE (RIC family)